MPLLLPLMPLLPIAALLYLAVALQVLARRKPGYSHLRHTISELGEVESPVQRIVAWGLFMPVGVAVLPVAYMFQSSAAPVAALAASIAIGYLVAALFPCDPGSPAVGSLRQGIHNLGGAVEYIGGGFSLMWAAETFGEEVRWFGFISLGAAFLLSVMPEGSPRGAVQRVVEIGLFASLAYLVWATASA